MLSSVLTVQINLGTSHQAKGVLDTHDALIQLIQEPPFKKGKAHLSARHLNTYWPPYGGSEETRPRAAIRVSRTLNSLAVDDFWSRDLVVVLVKNLGFDLIVASLYCDINKPVIEEKFELLVRYCEEKSLPLIVGADSNAHSTTWGPDNNNRGLVLEDFIAQNSLHVLNDGIKPTFVQGDRKSWIDVTLRNRFALRKDLGVGWEVRDEVSFSDHKYLTFSVKALPLKPQLKRDMTKVNWGKFRANVERRAATIRGDMELRTSSLIDSISLALDAQAPKRRVTLSKPRPKWWSDSLTKRKREINVYKKRRFANFDRLHFDNLKRQFKYEID